VKALCERVAGSQSPLASELFAFMGSAPGKATTDEAADLHFPMTARNRRVRVRDVGRSLPPEIGHPARTRPRRTARQTVGVVAGEAADIGERLTGGVVLPAPAVTCWAVL